MNREKRMMRPIHGVLTLVAFLVVLFVISPIIGTYLNLGMWGSFIGELLFLLVAVGAVFVFQGDFKRVFPMRKLKITSIAGTILLWMAVFGISMIITLILAYFFPEGLLETSQGLNDQFITLPFLVSVLIVAIAPAICEEAIFRGVLINSFWNPKRKWLVIVGVGIIFGLCHGSIYRFFPTAMLGILMGYIVVETNNIWYSVIMHFVNNLCPLILLQFAKKMLSGLQGSSEVVLNTQEMQLPLLSVGMYIVMGAGIPFFLYLGNYLLQKERKGNTEAPFHGEKKNILHFLLAISAIILISGIIVCIASLFVDASVLEQFNTSF